MSQNIYNILNQHSDVSRETSDMFEKFMELLLTWNKKMNLIGKGTVDDILQRHILDSLQLAKYLNKNDIIVDIGTGAGFPGLILSIAGYKDITLVESITKKCVFLNNVKEQLNLPVQIINDRVEELELKENTIITARAVAPLEKLFNFVYKNDNKISKYLFFKGRNYEEEIKKAEKLWKFKYKAFKNAISDEGIILKISMLQWKY